MAGDELKHVSDQPSMEMSISQVKANFAATIAAVQDGRVISVTRRGKIVAELTKLQRVDDGKNHTEEKHSKSIVEG